MEKIELLKIIEKLLKPEVDLNFLLDLPKAQRTDGIIPEMA